MLDPAYPVPHHRAELGSHRLPGIVSHDTWNMPEFPHKHLQQPEVVTSHGSSEVTPQILSLSLYATVVRRQSPLLTIREVTTNANCVAPYCVDTD